MATRTSFTLQGHTAVDVLVRAQKDATRRVP